MSPAALLVGCLLILYFTALSLLFLYGINCYIMIHLHRRGVKRMLQADEEVWWRWQQTAQDLPVVTVQLPIYNERYVVQRLIDAVARLEYPREKLEIQVLDDSTDETTAIAAELVEAYRRAGSDITLLHRTTRTGYKAGALRDGLAGARGEFIAIFDADFVPTPDFLMKTLPFFRDHAIAMVQVRWGHINRDYSLLTLVQSFGIDGHFWVEQAARCWSGLFMNFNGTAGIWRRTAIDDAGGWQADTLTEDLDLSYRAQLKGWRLKFLPQVVCPAEVPVQLTGARSQQHRWAKGSIQTARKLIPRILQADLPLFTKYQAVFHLTNYMVHPLMLLVVLSAPLLLQSERFRSARLRDGHRAEQHEGHPRGAAEHPGDVHPDPEISDRETLGHLGGQAISRPGPLAESPGGAPSPLLRLWGIPVPEARDVPRRSLPPHLRRRLRHCGLHERVGVAPRQHTRPRTLPDSAPCGRRQGTSAGRRAG